MRAADGEGAFSVNDQEKEEFRRRKGFPAGGAELTGFEYVHQPESGEFALVDCLESAQAPGEFKAQPFVTAAEVLRRDGDDAGARDLEIEWRKREIRSRRPRGEKWYVFRGYWISRAWHATLRWTIGYGFKPARVLWWSLGIIGIFTALLVFAKQPADIAPTKSAPVVALCEKQPQRPTEAKYENGFSEEEKQSYTLPDNVGGHACSYPGMYPLPYAVDAFLPVVNLGQTEYWTPTPGNTYGVLLSTVQWIVIISGWVLTAILVAGLTKIVR